MLLAALLAALAQPAAAQSPPPVDTAAVIEQALAAERTFRKAWRREWMETYLDSLPFGEAKRYLTASGGRRGGEVAYFVPPSAGRRLAAVHCHPAGPNAKRIASATSKHGACPTWVQETRATPLDESLDIDVAITPTRRARAVRARDTLLAALEEAERQLPGHQLITEQRVRFLMDAGLVDSALAVARGCRARPATCASLGGYVLARLGRVPEADSAFAEARGAMSETERCAWDDVSELLDDDGRTAYTRRSCAERDTLNARLWWLARPLFGEAGNARRAEHYARKVHVALRAPLGGDERHDWDATRAGDALAKMYVRYGVPTRLYWGGPVHDDGHDRYLATLGSPASPPYTAAEYSTGRLHLVPAWRAVLNPTTARPEHWELTAESPEHPGTWWPREHYLRRAGLITAIPLGQTALLRRAHGALLAVATDVGKTRGDAALIVSWHPDTIMQVGRALPGADGRLVVSGQAGTLPSLVGVEIPGAEGSPSSRLRFGLTPPPPLTAMRDGEAALSEPVLFAAPPGAAPPNDPDTVIARMLPSTTLRGARRVGVYWETYGIAPGDTVDVEVGVERSNATGIGRRVAAALGLASGGADGPVALRWREPSPGRVIRVLDAPRPIVARGAVLDLSRLPGGRYWLEVAVSRPGGEAVRARREIVLE